jgi:hypothetical protein
VLGLEDVHTMANLAIYYNILGWNTLLTMSNLAASYRIAGRKQEALDLN